MSPERLLNLSAALRRRGFRRLALFVKKVNPARVLEARAGDREQALEQL